MVGVHLSQFPQAYALRSILRLRTERTVGYTLRLCCLRLSSIDRFLGRLVKAAYLKQFGVLAAAEYILIDTLLILHIIVCIEFPLFALDGGRVVRRSMVPLVEVAPIQTAHLFLDGAEDGLCPIDDGIEIGLQCHDVGVLPVRSHVVCHLPTAHPMQGSGKVVLPLDIATDIRRPLAYIGVVGIGEHLFGTVDKGAAIDGIEYLLFVEGDTCDVDSTEPVFDFALRTLADIDKQGGAADALLQVGGQTIEVLLHAVAVTNGELTGEEAS